MAVLQRFGVIGDVHCEDARLAAVLERFTSEKVDAVLCVGDIVDGEGDPERTVRLLVDGGVHTVRGNHDRWLVEGTLVTDAQRVQMRWTRRAELGAASLAWLGALPSVRMFDTQRGPLLLCHGVGVDDMCRFKSHTALEECDEMQELVDAGEHALVVGGHSHERMVRKLGGFWFINAGTLSRKDGPGFALVDLARDAVLFYDVDEDGVITPAQTARL